MKNIPFVLWLLGFPLVVSITKAIDFTYSVPHTHSDGAMFFLTLIILWFYGFIAYELKE